MSRPRLLLVVSRIKPICRGGRGLFHVKVSQKHPQLVITIMKVSHKLIQQYLGLLCLICPDGNVFCVFNFEDDLMEQLFLFPCTDMLIVVSNLPVAPCLLTIVPLQHCSE